MDGYDKYYHYRLLRNNYTYIRSFYELEPIHPYLMPNTCFRAYLTPSGFHTIKNKLKQTKLYLEIIGQLKQRKRNFNQSKIYVLKAADKYLIYDVLNDHFYQTNDLSSLREWDLYYEKDPSLIKKPVQFYQLSQKEINQLKI